MYKEKCGFREKVSVCSFKEESCCPENCDMYNVEFTSKAIKAEIKRLKPIAKEMSKDIAKIKELKRMVKLEKEKPHCPEIVEFKNRLAKLNDISYGLQYLNKALLYCKRCNL